MFEMGAPTIRLFLFWGGLLFFLILELFLPYRAVTVSKVNRWVNNLALTLINSIILQILFSSTIVGMVLYVERHKLGILHMVQAPVWMKTLFAVLFIDFMLYVWHLLNHEVPLLWRFHRVHHSDMNMDVSSATRFHVGELAVSAIIKISLIFFLGAGLTAVVIFESVLVFCAQLHHSSLRVPGWFERLFWILFVPPSMHRIHHSVIIKERDTN
jgi:sterol desaturase/sphingolipid hydroxylase (fatty acid hydroxylase superfamily)